MYDHLYRLLDDRDVEVVVHADHPTLNREIAGLLEAGERIDVLATHSKYAPSQAQWLRPIDDLVDVSELAPLAVDLCRFESTLLCAPRLIDVRILWLRVDRHPNAPDTWNDLVDGSVRFGFPGRESGLFGTFYELVVGAGGRIFDDAGTPCFESDEAVAAIEQLVRLASVAPEDLPDWHYNQVDAALLDGRIDAAGVWPGGWGPIRDSSLVGVLEPHPYPTGTRRRVSYAGCHAWAIPNTCTDVEAAADLIATLSSFAAHALDASGGTVCAHMGAFAAVEPSGDIDRRRLDITRRTIAESMITYPPHPRFPRLEDAGWASINAAIRGRCTAGDALARIQRTALEVLAPAD
jgi:multiple sugar transport system substrate-binding protein